MRFLFIVFTPRTPNGTLSLLLLWLPNARLERTNRFAAGVEDKADKPHPAKELQCTAASSEPEELPDDPELPVATLIWRGFVAATKKSLRRGIKSERRLGRRHLAAVLHGNTELLKSCANFCIEYLQ
mmetsp:Transcript_31976/g.72986  ORF Transcript_31976/g.72986 Transcript_31976/m.72986 type:complete len:127 (-) Transcript_31976:103-483(-)